MQLIVKVTETGERERVLYTHVDSGPYPNRPLAWLLCMNEDTGALTLRSCEEVKADQGAMAKEQYELMRQAQAGGLISQ